MKKPKIMKFMSFVQERSSDDVDWNNKTTRKYFIEIPYWLARAYNLRLGRKVILTMFAEPISIKNMEKLCTDDMPYFKKNWLRKVSKMRKLNSNYIKVRRVTPNAKQKQ